MNLCIVNNKNLVFIIYYFIIFLLTTGCTTLPKPIDHRDIVQTCIGDNKIYVINHGWHTGISLKASDINHVIPELSTRFPDSIYYEIGWGDTGFYQAKEITTGLTLRAMFWSSGSVLHVVGLKENPKDYFAKSEVKILNCDNDGYEKILEFIKDSFQKDQDGYIIPEHHGIYGDSQFYTGVGRYQLFNTCNKWTAKALNSGGYHLDPTFKLTSSSVMSSLDSACP